MYVEQPILYELIIEQILDLHYYRFYDLDKDNLFVNYTIEILDGYIKINIRCGIVEF